MTSEVYSQYLALTQCLLNWISVSELVKESIPFETISYGPEETSRVDIYGTSLSKGNLKSASNFIIQR